MAIFDFIEQQGVGAGFVYKNTTACYYFNGTTFNQVTSPNYPATTVRGIVYLDGTYYVMTPAGSIYGSNLDDITTWSALNVIQARMEPDEGVCLARQLNSIVAFGSYSTEFFYDAGNATGSPLLPYSTAFLEIGCASAGSVAQTENTLFFMGVSRAKGRGIYKLEGTTPQYISTPYIDRILNSDTLATVTSYFIKINGHSFYILYLENSSLTLVYDTITSQWGKWTRTSLSSTKNVTGGSWSNGVATLTITSHGFNDGDTCVVSSITPSGYNGTYVISVIDSNTVSYSLTSAPGAYVSGGTAANYVEGAFKMASYTAAGNLDLVQDSTTGTVYAVDTGIYNDDGNPIEFHIRTPKFDGGNNKEKYFSRAEIIGDKVSATAYIRYTNDDYQTYSAYRPIDLSLNRSKISRLGKARRRAFEIRHTASTALRLEALELDVEEGIN